MVSTIIMVAVALGLLLTIMLYGVLTENQQR